MPTNPLQGFAVDRSRIRTIGHDLQRPECILAERDGTLSNRRIAKSSAPPTWAAFRMDLPSTATATCGARW